MAKDRLNKLNAIKLVLLTVDARISCGQHSSRKLLHTLASLNFNWNRSFAPGNINEQKTIRENCRRLMECVECR